jgi:mono/diheme cytochrome c family protein
MNTMRTSIRTLAACAGLLVMPLHPHAADTVTLSEGFRFVEQDGESLYRAVCQGCHMPDGQGATGAGAYPALAANPRLAGAAYAVHNVLHGRKGMPPFKDMLTDAQVAAVVNHVRTHMGNTYTDAVTAADVRKQRQEKPR